MLSVDLVDKVNCTPFMFSGIMIGGGQSFIHGFMQYPGASKSVVGMYAPYHKQDTINFLGKSIDKFTGEEASRSLAKAAYSRVLAAGIVPEYAIGFGVSATLSTSSERVGRTHSAYFSMHNAKYSCLQKIDFSDDLTREEQESILRGNTLDWIYSYCVNGTTIKRPWYESSSSFIRVEDVIDTRAISLLSHPSRVVIYPGSWNPIHQGHKEIHSLAVSITKQAVVLELSMDNADKGCLDYFDVKARMSDCELPYIVTNSPTFIEKAYELRTKFPNIEEIVFVVGADTFERVLNPKYSVDKSTSAIIKEFKQNRIMFLPFSRSGWIIPDYDGVKEITIQSSKARQYDNPISSTSIRSSTN